jgi:hypothetical protein
VADVVWALLRHCRLCGQVVMPVVPPRKPRRKPRKPTPKAPSTKLKTRRYFSKQYTGTRQHAKSPLPKWGRPRQVPVPVKRVGTRKVT